MNQEYNYPIKINGNIFIELFKERFIKLLIEPNNKIRKKVAPVTKYIVLVKKS